MGSVDHLSIHDAFPLVWMGMAWEFCYQPVWISICTTMLPLAAKEFSPALHRSELVEDETIKTFRLNMHWSNLLCIGVTKYKSILQYLFQLPITIRDYETHVLFSLNPSASFPLPKCFLTWGKRTKELHVWVFWSYNVTKLLPETLVRSCVTVVLSHLTLSLCWD